ncbi:MAG TPA: gamma-glutamyl-phosphate reductase, partial [Pseudomonadales bacterium]|nr:gamma-glutamyl-phosphate reductase [Pseudomonadales bacterium]
MNQPLAQQMQQIGLRAREASRTLARASTGDKNRALIATAEALQQHRTTLLHANGHDLEAARARQLEPALIERLTLNDARIDAMIESLHQVAALADPVGAVTD